MTTQKKKFGIMQWLPVVVPVCVRYACENSIAHELARSAPWLPHKRFASPDDVEK